MKKKHIITLSGKPGSGKSSTADKVAEFLSYTRHSSGDMVRQILAKSHMTLEEYNNKAETDHDLDDKVDEQLRALRDKKDIVVDSRLGFYWIPESFKVYLDLDIGTATARIFKDTVTNKSRSAVGTSSNSLAEVSRQVRERMENEQQRFKSMYGVDPYNAEHFDLVINTSRHDPQSVAISVFDNYKKWLEAETWEPVHTGVPLGYSFKNSY
ncbi:cytidylate kinase family protein [Candidatus Nomurabacteria bacterium]|nr:cytidylate kinase family protein [Candidatus Kaiserbacteria bacterium]MCB9815746.1 cytidylate kinase family protein [Candidatus Nomurabacteria bacterium]